MVRISKLTDYALVIMAYMAEASIRGAFEHSDNLNPKSNPSPNAKLTSNVILQARDIAAQTHVSLPTVSKLLKILTKHQFLNSVRGTQGGYQLAMAMEKISVVDLIQAMEGPLAITECNLGHQHCSSETQCAIRTPWLQINQVITDTLSAIKLSDLIKGKLRASSKKTSIPLVIHAVSEASSFAAKATFARDIQEGKSHGH